MRVELSVMVRGGVREVIWNDGALVGDDEILRRVRREVDKGRVDVTDLLSVVRVVERVTAQHVRLMDLDLAEPDETDSAGAVDPQTGPLAWSA